MATRADMRKLWLEVKANSQKLNSCPKHRYHGNEHVKLGMRVTCLECGGQMQTADLASYIRGYEAAGGDANDIWPGWRDRKVDNGS